ncbi:MAG: hypothetical protein PHT07_07385 [Paludibacter sp.]|nr:hypothetical protein [Paludibacter sp.]
MNKYLLIIIAFCFLASICSCNDNVSLNSPNGLVVIIKADDLGDTTANWNRFMKIVIDNKICAGVGVIPGRVTTQGSISEMKRINELRQSNEFPYIEFWNHGYDHHKTNKETEFSGSDLNDQTKRIQMSQNFLFDNLSSTCHTFGAPFNKTSGVTSSALVNSPEINVWLSYQKIEKHFLGDWKDPNKKVITKMDQHIILNTDYLYLNDFPIGDIINNYERDKEKPYVLIQIHPAKWDERRFNQFEKLIHFYKDRHLAIFMTPYQYFRYLHKEYTQVE